MKYQFLHGSRTVREIVRVSLHIIIVLVFIIGAIYRWFTEPFGVYWQYFTHWSWTYQTLFYIATLIGRLYHPLFMWVVFLFFLGVFAIYWFVLVLVWIAISMDANFLLQFSKEHGGPYGTNLVLIGNSIYHTVPVLAGLIFILMYWGFLKPSIHTPVVGKRVWIRIVVMLYQIYAIPTLITAAYFIAFDIHKVYHVEIPNWIGWVSLLIVCTVANGLLYYHSLPPRVTEHSACNKYKKASKRPCGSMAVIGGSRNRRTLKHARIEGV